MSYQIPEEEFKQYIPKDIEKEIYNCISKAIYNYKKWYKDLNHRHSGRTKASIIHDLIIHNIKLAFQNRENARYYTRRNCFQLIIDNGNSQGKICVIRFKKLNNKKIAHYNIPKQQISEYEQVSIFTPIINLNAGYILEGLNVSMFITRPKDFKSNEWEWKLSFMPMPKPVTNLHIHDNETGLPDRRPKTKESRSEENAVQE